MAGEDLEDPGVHRSAGPGPELRTWALLAALLTVAGAAWAFATPLMAGADESDQAIRAAAVVRGQVVGGETLDLLGHPNVLIEVEVPEAYGAAKGVAPCFIDYPDDSPADQSFTRSEPQQCEGDLDGGRSTVAATTLQYRGQPTYYAVVGLPSLVWPDGTGVRAMRLVSAALTAAMLAAALVSARRLAQAPLLPVAVLAGATPVCLWLAGQVNTGGFEIAAALWLWTAALVLVRSPVVTRAMVRDVGIAFVLLTTCRGLSPLFGPLALVAAALVADGARLRALARRRDVRGWGVGGGVALGASVAWLAYIQLRYPLDDRPGTGVASALGTWDFYLRQTVGVFGVNDVVVPLPAVVAWGAVAAVVVVVGLLGADARTRVVTLAVAVGGFALNITAEGLSLPPIGYYWQGRYVLPVLVGVAVLASGPPTRPVLSGVTRRAHPWALTAVLVAVHAWAFAFAVRHFAGRGRGDVGFVDAVRDPSWSAAVLPGWAWVGLYVTAVGATAAVALGPARSLGGRPEDPSPSVAGLDQSSDLRGT